MCFVSGFWKCRPLAELYSKILMIPAVDALQKYGWDGKFTSNIADAGKFLLTINDESYECTSGSFITWRPAIWFTIVTMTSTGFGDVHAESDLGKVYACVMMILGIVAVSLLVGEVVNKLRLTVNEKGVLTWIERSKLELEMRVTALNTITLWYRVVKKSREEKVAWGHYYENRCSAGERYRYRRSHRHLIRLYNDQTSVFRNILYDS